jgi:hypothetical protein
MATQEAIIDEMLEPLAEALTPESAKLLAELRVPSTVQAQVDALAAKCNEGQLTPTEREDYENYVRIGNIFSLLKAKARRVITDSAHG